MRRLDAFTMMRVDLELGGIRAREVPLLRPLMAVVALVWLLRGAPAHAEMSRVALVAPEPQLESAIRATLSPWQTEVITERGVQPRNDMPASVEQARVVAKRLHVQAVVWVSRSGQGPALWMYDAREDRVIARALDTSPPFDEPTAAGVALIVKTLLRYSDVAPAAERAQAPARSGVLSFGLLLGARHERAEQGRVEVRAGVQAALWPAAFRQFGGLGLQATWGPGLSVQDSRFAGRWSEVSMLVRAQSRFPVGVGIDAGLGLGAGVDVATLSGVVVTTQQKSDATRVNPTLSADAELGFRFSPAVRLGLRLGVERPLRKQIYLTFGEPVFKVDALRIQSLLTIELSPF